ncbi:Protein stu-1 [Purpureocillium lavendulum]|uniref:Protein stu-1 n=1 Tax=Purpureocillium lavendulum TaxID=1247861 RepID=A0AB34G8V8_9HYPO|nr:Protein stu-1 [Purpureocillium lavendulum]
MATADHPEAADEYGRYSGCFRDYRLPPFSLWSHVEAIQASSPRSELAEPVHNPSLRTWSIPQPRIRDDFAVEAQDALIQDLCASPEPILRTPCILPRWRALRELLMPVDQLDLGSLPEIDSSDYAESVLSMRTCLLSKAWLPLCALSVEGDEALAFPSTSEHLATVLEREMAAEAIDVVADVTAPETSDVGSPLGDEYARSLSKRVSREVALWGRLEPLTPPLSPISESEPGSPFIPGSDAAIIDLVSAPSSPTPSSVQRLQAQAHGGCLDSDVAASVCAVNTSPLPLLTNSRMDNAPVLDLAVEVPVASVGSGPPSTVDAPIATDLPVIVDADVASHKNLCESFFDDEFAALLDSRQQQVADIAYQEYLCPFDAISHISVPTVDTQIPKPEWSSAAWTARRHFAELQSHTSKGPLVPCMPRDNLLESELRWAPLPRGSGIVKMEEELTTSLASEQYADSDRRSRPAEREPEDTCLNDSDSAFDDFVESGAISTESQITNNTFSTEAGASSEPLCLAAVEVDVCLTPTTGLIATSLVKVRQKPLPGSKRRAALRDQICNVSQKYERLIVLVSESNAGGEFSGELSVSDVASYADFVRFTNSLDTSVSTYFVPGADRTLARWILACMSRCSAQMASLVGVIASEESPWELFFRRAGMNAMSAQVMSKSLIKEHGDSGLAEFLAMPTETKVAKYGLVLGGHKALARCCTLLDKTWL